MSMNAAPKTLGDMLKVFLSRSSRVSDRVSSHLQQVLRFSTISPLSDEHFTVDGTLLEAWASVKSFQPKDKNSSPPPEDPENPRVNFHGEKRSNQTQESKTDPDALRARKGAGKEAKLSYSGNLLVESRH